ncbi:3540_t:CDS:2 [Funneliformis geosporum]|uniref:11484_t:CDS:1 n=1 Tax=Funneliformis geosporum TaxID=1117311 RepID=A0A9W4SVM8_9GLOM|nr:3540_t:CDS:2 [Funneliformis geosporum]CAI2183270.1 11484_t:CDS:2 [Funneliformis geosporum]
MSSAKRPYNETMSSPSSTSNASSSLNDDFMEEKVEQGMDIEQNEQIVYHNLIEGNFRRKKLNNDKVDQLNTFISNPFPSTLNNSFQPYTSSRNYPLKDIVSDTKTSSIPFHKVSATVLNEENNELDKNKNNNCSLKQNSFDSLTSSPTISISTSETRISDVTITASNDYFSSTIDFTKEYIRTQLNESDSKGPFYSFYPQIYNSNRLVIFEESFSYLRQLYEFCDDSSTKLASNVTSVLAGLIALLNVQLDGFDIPFIEHHKWNGSNFYGSIDIGTLLDHLDEGLGISTAEFVFYNRDDNGSSFIKTGRSVLQCGYRKTRSKLKPFDTPSPQTLLNNNELRHAVLDVDAERETQLFLESLAAEEQEENYTDHEDETYNRYIRKSYNETDDDLIHSEESSFDEVDDVSDIESVVTDSTVEEDWLRVSRNNSH